MTLVKRPLQFRIRPVPPFRLDLTVWALRRRARNLVDRWDGTTYRRVVVIDGHAAELSVRQTGSPTVPLLVVAITPRPRTDADRRYLRRLLDRLLGLRIDLTDWYQTAARDPRLRQLAEKFRGVKPPRFPTVFEGLVNAFACQQFSLEACLTLVNRLAATCGPAFDTPGAESYGFPAPCDVLRLSPQRLRTIGFSRQKGGALLGLARAITPGDLDLESLVRREDEVIGQKLRELRGVGRWTAEYVLLRGFGRLHVFPGDDVGAQKRLARWLGRPHPLDYAGVRRAVARWQPYAGLVYFHLLLDGLSQSGALDSISGA
jgi:DNA-3-methyladenine glycosylase II